MPVFQQLRALLPLGLSYIASSGSLLISSAAQLLTFAILARFLGVDEFSVFIAVTAVSAVAMAICGLGGTEALIRRVAREPRLYPDFLGHNILLSGGTGLVLMAGGLAILPVVYPLASDGWSNFGLYLLFLTTNVVLARITFVVEQVFIAHSNFFSANLNVVLLALSRLIAAVLACIVFGANSLAEWIVWAFFAQLAVTVFAVWSIVPLGAPRLVLRWEEMWNGILFSTPFILRTLRGNVDLLLLTALTSPEVVASYAVARRIVDNAYLSVDALNRLVYPGSAAATRGGIHQALGRFRKVLWVSVGLSVLTALAIVVIAPFLPLLFGAEYVSLPIFSQILAPTIILVAIWVTAVEALGSSGHHGHRALIFNGAVTLGGGAIILATWLYGIDGTFGAIYVTELLTGIAAWLVLMRLAESDRRAAKSFPLDPVPSK